MKVFTQLPVPGQIINPVVTIGTFDGVHLGHGKILDRVKQRAGEINGQSVVITFDPHPRKIIFPFDENLKLLNTQQEKILNLSGNKIDHLIVIPFTKEFSRMTAMEFVRDVLVNQIGVNELIIGYDHHFGRNREGSIANLVEMAALFGFKVEEIPAKLINEAAISSTKIRNAILTGDIQTANEFLGYKFELSGTVVKGEQLGRNLGFPTANLQLTDLDKIIPARGVYRVDVQLEDKLLPGVMNVGYKPTVSKGNSLTVEVHVLDFNQDLYGKSISIRLLQKIREERKFNSLNDLKEQISKDVQFARNL